MLVFPFALVICLVPHLVFVASVLPVPRCAACICASCSGVHHAAVQPSLCPLYHSSLTPAGCPSSAPSRDSYSFWSVTDDSSGYMRFASAHVIYRPPFECVTSAHHTIPTSASRRAYLHGRACVHHLTLAACSHIRVRMYEYNEHNESLFISGAVGAAQHINITTLFSGVRTVIRDLI